MLLVLRITLCLLRRNSSRNTVPQVTRSFCAHRENLSVLFNSAASQTCLQYDSIIGVGLGWRGGHYWMRVEPACIKSSAFGLESKMEGTLFFAPRVI